MPLSDTATILAVLNAQGLGAGANLSDAGFERLIADYRHYMRDVQRDDLGLPISATMDWPDDSAGEWSPSETNKEWGVVTAFTITHTLSSKIATVTLAANLLDIATIDIDET